MFRRIRQPQPGQRGAAAPAAPSATVPAGGGGAVSASLPARRPAPPVEAMPAAPEWSACAEPAPGAPGIVSPIFDALAESAADFAEDGSGAGSGTGTDLTADLGAYHPAQPLRAEFRRHGAPEQEAEHKRRRRLVALRVDLHKRLLEELNLAVIDKVSERELKAEIGAVVREAMADSDLVLSRSDVERLTEELVDEVTGLGPLEPLLKDPTITDILVNTHEHTYIERDGVLVKTDVQFKDQAHLMRVISKIVSGVGRRVDESQPWVDARLPDGSRVNALVPPCAVDGPLLSIRKFAKIPYTVEALIGMGTFSEEMALYLRAAVRCKLNVLVSGGTGSGKTTTLNALSSFIPPGERIVTIEDTAELQLQQEHVGRMESRPPNIEGTGAVTLRDLLRNALRMRPDRIIVGEVRGAEVLDMMQAMNTGHEGSMTTLHANSPRDALSRLENMVGMSGFELPLRALRSNIASALNVIVQISRLTDGRRRVTSVQEIVGMEGDIVTMQEIFRFERQGMEQGGIVRGRFVGTGIRSAFSERFASWGHELPARLFRPGP